MTINKGTLTYTIETIRNAHVNANEIYKANLLKPCLTFVHDGITDGKRYYNFMHLYYIIIIIIIIIGYVNKFD
jgi:hypothetical protein